MVLLVLRSSVFLSSLYDSRNIYTTNSLFKCQFLRVGKKREHLHSVQIAIQLAKLQSLDSPAFLFYNAIHFAQAIPSLFPFDERY